jgi:hypothetical protein
MSWLEVDKLTGKTFWEGKFKSPFIIPHEQPVRAVTYNGIFKKYPRTFTEWQNYSGELLILFDKVWKDQVQPNWNMLNFRFKEDFRAGIWAGFTATWLIFINYLPSEKTKFLAYKHITKGISIFDNQYSIAPRNSKQYKRSKEIYHLATGSFKNELYNEWYKKFNLKKAETFIIDDTTLSLTSHYPVQIKKENGILIRKPFYQKNSSEHLKHLLENINIINDQLVKWVASGAIIVLGTTVQIKSKIKTSLVLAYNESADKFRCCFDGGSFKAIQGYTVPCNLDTLSETLLFINKNDYLSKYDDSSGFLQPYLDKPSQDMTHFRWGNYIFKFYAAAFGIARVPGDFQLLNSCAVSFLRRHGIPVSL